MRPSSSGSLKFLVLGGGPGWHLDQLTAAATRVGATLDLATYESLRGEIVGGEISGGEISGGEINSSKLQDADSGASGGRFYCDSGALTGYDAILTRTMPAGNLETVTFRLAILHAVVGSPRPIPVINSPRGLEIAIDKFATLAVVSAMGIPVPETRVVQSRGQAMAAFHELGGDCVIKPIFGGEGRGVMRVRDAELARYTFATLENLNAVIYVQTFVPPGGRDTRYLVIGDRVLGFRRTNDHDFRTNVTGGGVCQSIDVTPADAAMARSVLSAIGLSYGSVDVLDGDDGIARVVEVNGIPGWKGAQQVCDVNISDWIIDLACREVTGAGEDTA